MDVQAAYYIEPVLGSIGGTRATRWPAGSRGAPDAQPLFRAARRRDLTALGGARRRDCDRGSFLAGNWGGGTLSPLPDPCGTVIVRRKLPPGAGRPSPLSWGTPPIRPGRWRGRGWRQRQNQPL